MKITLTCYEKSHIRTFTYQHAKKTNEVLKTTKKVLLWGIEPGYAHRIFLVNFKTHLGDNDTYWYPLFAEMEKLLKARMDIIDCNALWDAILPVGTETLQKIRARVKSHKGKFVFPLPFIGLQKVGPSHVSEA